MKWLVGLLLVINNILAVDLREQDKKKHVAACAAISVVVATNTNNMWYGIGAAMLVGVAKEMTDDKFDKEDLEADLIGSVIGVQVEVLKW